MTSDIRNPFGAPIPGQSLTDNPGNNKWEHPPQYTDVEKASEDIWDLLHEPTKLEQTLLLLKSGVSIEALTKGILFSGFVECKFTPDFDMTSFYEISNFCFSLERRRTWPLVFLGSNNPGGSEG